MLLIPIVLGVGAIVAAAATPLLRSRSRHQLLSAARERARAVYQRLGHCVETTDPGVDHQAAEQLRLAEERWHTTGALLAGAGTVEECQVAERAAAEGLRHVVVACQLLGIDPPDVPGDPAGVAP